MENESLIGMGRTLETKNKIIDLLRTGPKTPTQIYKELGLAPSTVSQHLKELMLTGKITGGYDEHFRNTKYYRLAEVAPISLSNRLSMPSRISPAYRNILGAMAVLAVIAIVLYSLPQKAASNETSLSAQPSQRYVQVSLTDPPTVPNGTTALVASYSAVSLLLKDNSNNSTSTVNLNSSGTVNLLALINASSVIGTTNIPANSEIESVSFSIDNASINFGNTIYPVLLSNKQMAAKVVDNSSSNSTVLLDLSPTVALIYTDNSTVFVMVPSFRAIIVNGVSVKARPNEPPSELNSTYKRILYDTRLNLEISNASLSVNGTNSTISVTVKDNSSQPVVLDHLMLKGNESVQADIGWPLSNRSLNINQIAGINLPIVGSGSQGSSQSSGSSQSGGSVGAVLNTVTNTGASVVSSTGAAISSAGPGFSSAAQLQVDAGAGFRLNAHELDDLAQLNYPVQTSNASVNANISAFSHALLGFGGNLSAVANLNFNSSQMAALTDKARTLHSILQDQHMFRALSFVIGTDGSLTLLSNSAAESVSIAEETNTKGYTLNPGQSVTLRFKGKLSLANDKLILTLQQGTPYSIDITGHAGASVGINATAT